ncbi:hypothetical protein HZB60_04805 [candidate division KSB1 bacterium]|nr:hypothetical protein [candidate division KSB1 bacterium]
MPKLLRSAALLVGVMLLASGCAAGYYQRVSGVNDWTPAQVLHRTLDRWVGWRSMSAQFKLRVQMGETKLAARGHLIYLIGERIEFGFRKPWDEFIGTFYVIPDRAVYWGTSPIPRVYGLSERIDLSELLGYPFPDWDPRDFLPLAVSGRTGGLQPDSVWETGSGYFVRATSDSVVHELTMSLKRGMVTAEVVRRAGRDPLYKRYDRQRTLQGWPLPTQVVCTDSLRTFTLTWALTGIDLDAQEYMLEDTIQTFGAPTGGRR